MPPLWSRSNFEGLCAVAEDTPLVLAQDAYERIQSGGKLDSLIRTLVVKPAVAKSRRLAFVIAGRGELSGEYRRSFDAEPLLLYETSLGPFSEAETAQLLNARGIPESVAADVQRATKGVPLAVDLIAASVPRGSGRLGRRASAADRRDRRRFRRSRRNDFAHSELHLPGQG